MNGYTSIEVNFIPLTDYMDTYYITTKIPLSSDNIGTFIDHFYIMELNVPPGTLKTIHYETDPDYPYMYFAFHSYSLRISEFKFKTNTTSSER